MSGLKEKFVVPHPWKYVHKKSLEGQKLQPARVEPKTTVIQALQWEHCRVTLEPYI